MRNSEIPQNQFSENQPSTVFRVLMVAFHDLPQLRPVTVPNQELKFPLETQDNVQHNLAAIFWYGQNDVQDIYGYYSVSVDDVIVYPGEHGFQLWRVMPEGFAILAILG